MLIGRIWCSCLLDATGGEFVGNWGKYCSVLVLWRREGSRVVCKWIRSRVPSLIRLGSEVLFSVFCILAARVT